MTVPELSTQDLLPTLRPQSCLCFVHTDRWGGVTMLVTLIQLGESPWLEFPGSIPVWNVDSHPQHLLWKLFLVVALGALEEVLC